MNPVMYLITFYLFYTYIWSLSSSIPLQEFNYNPLHCHSNAYINTKIIGKTRACGSSVKT